mgnify:CR=1 FL=1
MCAFASKKKVCWTNKFFIFSWYLKDMGNLGLVFLLKTPYRFVKVITRKHLVVRWINNNPLAAVLLNQILPLLRQPQQLVFDHKRNKEVFVY